MRARDFLRVLSERKLNELRMAASNLKQFVNSPEAQGMRAGFEAELIFQDLGGAGDDDDREMVHDYDQDERPHDIDHIEAFFNSGDFAEGLSRRQRNDLDENWAEFWSEQLDEAWSEEESQLVRDWIQENVWDPDEQSEQELDQLVLTALEDHNRSYEKAHEEFSEGWDGVDQQDWIRYNGWHSMADIAQELGFVWPHYRYDDDQALGSSFDENNAQKLADDLTAELGLETLVSSGYHSATRDDHTWIFEPDSSLEGESGDMPVEIVSPPMPLATALEIMPKFFAWAKSQGAYANGSTGFHMSVSMPEHAGNKLDYTKLALFLGDEYVLKQFGRSANTYARSALQKIRDRQDKVDVSAVLNTMRQHLDQMATQAVATSTGFGKYTSINPKGKYIEFRSAGGTDYFEDLDKIQSTLMRYAQATSVAMDPEAHKAEYGRKLYKLLTKVQTQTTVDPRGGTQRTEVKTDLNDAIGVFSDFVAGKIPKDQLKGKIKWLQHQRQYKKQDLGDPKGNYVIRATSGGEPTGPVLYRYNATGASDALAQVDEIAKRLGLSKGHYGLWHKDNVPPEILNAVPGAPATQTPATDQMTAPAADDPAGNYVLRRREGNSGMGDVIYRFSAPNNMAAIEAARQWTTARGLERRSVWLDHISGVPPEVLNARPVRATLGEPRPAFTEPRSSSIPEVPLDIAQNFREPPASWDSGAPIVTEPQNFPSARSTGGEFRGRWKIVDGLGRVVHIFGGIGNVQADARRVAAEWARRTGFDGNIEVYPIMEPQ
jgi:hypothetical protein